MQMKLAVLALVTGTMGVAVLGLWANDCYITALSDQACHTNVVHSVMQCGEVECKLDEDIYASMRNCTVFAGGLAECVAQPCTGTKYLRECRDNKCVETATQELDPPDPFSMTKASGEVCKPPER